MTPKQFIEFLTGVFGLAALHTVDGSLHLIFMDWRHMAEMMAAGQLVYSEFKNLIVWAKTNAGMGSLWRSQHELCFAWKKGVQRLTSTTSISGGTAAGGPTYGPTPAPTASGGRETRSSPIT